MMALDASKIVIVDGVEDDAQMRERARRLRSGIRTDDVLHVGDAELNRLIEDEKLLASRRHGMRDDVKPIVIFNYFRFDDPPEVREKRKEDFPALFANGMFKFNGYGGFDWRDSGSKEYRERTGLVCQPAYQLHTIVGCPFLCAYCSLGRFINIMVNIEDFVSRLDGWLQKCPRQTLYQYDNYTDTVCFEPEYGGAKLLVEYFARKPGKALELYVGKSDNVDFLLDLDHNGHTVCCWSLSAETQSTRIERRTAPMSNRIEAMRKCQKAGYPVRVRFSPIIPVRNWQIENIAMIRELFDKVEPDVVTIEPLRFLNYNAIRNSLDTSLLDPDFLRIMETMPEKPAHPGCELPDDYRKEIYRFVIDEIERVSPKTPYAFCRERRAVWDFFAADLARHDQTPDRYICNCGPYSAPATCAIQLGPGACGRLA